MALQLCWFMILLLLDFLLHFCSFAEIWYMCIQSIAHSSPASVLSRLKPREHALRQHAYCLPNPAWPLLAKHTISSHVQTVVAENNLGLDYSFSLPREMLLPMLLLCWVLLQIVPDLYYWETLFGLSNISSLPNRKLAAAQRKVQKADHKNILAVLRLKQERAK